MSFEFVSLLQLKVDHSATEMGPPPSHLASLQRREGRREGGREGKEGGREGGRERRKGGREGEKERREKV